MRTVSKSVVGPAVVVASGTYIPSALERQVVAKVSRRLLWFLFAAFCCSFLDRINIGFAALSMNRALGLTATAYGLATTFFYIGYIACEIPSNLIMARVGARIWIARIMITWGIASAATMLATGASSLYLIRAIVGIAEAGFLPGALLYITYWFPYRYRAKATALFFIAQPITTAVGSVLSGFILNSMQGTMGLSGWQWLFLLEGIPSVVFGVVAFFYLTDSPAKARWLSDEEKSCLAQLLAEGRGEARGRASFRAVLAELGQPVVLALALTYFCLVNSLNAITVWVPQIVRSITASDNFLQIGMLTAIPSIVTVFGMLFWSSRSDREQERKWHTALALLLAAAGWLLTAYAANPVVRMAGIVAASTGALTAMTVFWTIPGRCLSAEGRPAGLAFINMMGIVGAAVSPVIFGVLRDLTQSFASGLLYASSMLVIAAAIIVSLRVDSQSMPAAA